MMVMSGNLGLSLACIVKVLVWLLATEAVHAAISTPVSYATSVGTNYVLCTDVVSIAAGNHHTCGVLKDQTVMCWGDNTYGQLGDGTTTSSRVPVVAPGLSNVRSISARGLHTCAVMWNGTARCWGSNGRGQLGDGTSTDRYLPVVVSGLNSVRSIFASLQHTCAVMEDNTASCWGSNDRGQLGDGTTVSSSLPLVVSGLSDVRAITAGYAHTCALSGPALNGVVHCWGDNSFGQLGDGSNSIWSHVPTVVSGLSNASMISAGWGHTCMVMDDHTARCWGYNSCGHLGDGTTTESNIPVVVAGLSNVRSVSTGDVHTCGLLDNGAAQCWGCNDLRELGDGTTTNSRVPVVVSGVGGARSISAGGWHTCVVFGNNTASCWGWDNYGQLGYGASSGDTVQPVLVSGCAPRNSSSNYTSNTCSGVVEVVGGAAHSCAVFKDGAARCWGSSASYALGNGSSTVGRAVLVVVSGVSNVRNISANGGHTCAVLEDKTARCWGGNDRGQLGDGTRTDSSVPVVVSGLSNVSSISCGWSHTCAVMEDGTARCWGDSLYGALGDGTLMPSNVPVVVANLSNVRSIASGKQYTCAVLHDGTARCWGCNFAGQLGNGSVSHQHVPVMVSGLSNVRSISAASGNAAGHTCADLENGAARCWGDNSNGQLGNGTTGSNSEVPVVVLGLSNVRSIAAGAVHTCAVLEDGTARCWGDNYFGQFGDGTNTGSNAPMAVPGLSSVRSIAAGALHTCAALEDGTARCWGTNYAGELGDGTTIDRWKPVVVSGCAPPPISSNYTECRQVIASVRSQDGREGLNMFGRPCFFEAPLRATLHSVITITKCTRIEYLAAARPRLSECADKGDFSCWIEVIYNGTRGWIIASIPCGGSEPGGVEVLHYVSYCPAAACPTQAPDTTCRQINARDEVELRRWPCYDDAYVPPDGGGNNSVITYLKRGQTVTYNNTGSQQTSVCGKPPMEGVEPMCWIAVKTATGQEGFIPAAQGDFADAFCNPKPTTYAESLVIQPCAGELYAECRQVTAAAGLIVCPSPCGDIVPPTVRIPKCGNFEYIVGSNVTRSCSNTPSCWGMIRYRNDEQLLQVGWVQVSSVSCTATGAANVADCGAAACRPAGTACRQVISNAARTMRAKPCQNATALRVLPKNAVFNYWGADYKISSTCSTVTGSNIYDGFCWVKATYGKTVGWLPAGYIGNRLTSAFCDYNGTSPGEAYVRSFCDYCLAKKVQCQQKECYKPSTCNPANGLCSPWKPLQAGMRCKSQPNGKCNGRGQCKVRLG